MKCFVAVRIIAVLLWLNLPVFLLGQTKELALKHGTYVDASVSCKEPPFAAMQAWDGIGFFGPHTSRCTSRVLGRHGTRFQISTSCGAIGDGTPNLHGQIDTEIISLVRVSEVRFAESSDTKPERTFRWCSADTGLGNFRGDKR